MSAYGRFQSLAPRLTSVLQRVGFSAPTNLASVGDAQSVHTLELREMLLDGALEPVAGGFKVYLYDSHRECIGPLSRDVALTTRQRFTLAHEIAHTFFFELKGGKPTPVRDIPKHQDLESVCDWLASEMLLPEALLRSRLSRFDAFTIESAVQLGEEFQVSIESVVRRIARSPDLVAASRIVLLVHSTVRGEGIIVASFFGNGMRELLRPPSLTGERRPRLSDWCPAAAGLNPSQVSKLWVEIAPGLSGRAMTLPKSRTRYLLELAASRDI